MDVRRAQAWCDIVALNMKDYHGRSIVGCQEDRTRRALEG